MPRFKCVRCEAPTDYRIELVSPDPTQVRNFTPALCDEHRDMTPEQLQPWIEWRAMELGGYPQ